MFIVNFQNLSSFLSILRGKKHWKCMWSAGKMKTRLNFDNHPEVNASKLYFLALLNTDLKLS